MPIQYVFWFLMLLWLVFGVGPNWPRGDSPAYRPFGASLLLFVLIALLGWQVFGAAVK